MTSWIYHVTSWMTPYDLLDSMESMDLHGICGFAWNPWICMESMDLHGISWNPWNSMDSMNLHGITWNSYGFHRFAWNPWKSMESMASFIFRGDG